MDAGLQRLHPGGAEQDDEHHNRQGGEVNCVICGKPITPIRNGHRATTCPGACRHERNKRLWKANGAKRRKGFRKDDGIAEAREWLKRFNAKLGRNEE